MNWGQCGSKKDNQWTSIFRSYWEQYSSKTIMIQVNVSRNWEQRCAWRISSYCHLGFPCEHGYDSWKMLSHSYFFNECRKDTYHQDWLWNNAALEGHLHIVILGLSFEAWLPTDVNMIECKWMLKRCKSPRLNVEQRCTCRTSSHRHSSKHGYRLMLSWLYLNEYWRDAQHRD
jgi:hypothetical protein